MFIPVGGPKEIGLFDIRWFTTRVKSGEELYLPKITGNVAVFEGGKVRTDEVTGCLVVYRGGEAEIDKVIGFDEEHFENPWQSAVYVAGEVTIGTVDRGHITVLDGNRRAHIGRVSGAGGYVLVCEGGRATIPEVSEEARVYIDYHGAAEIGHILNEAKVHAAPGSYLARLLDNGSVIRPEERIFVGTTDRGFIEG